MIFMTIFLASFAFSQLLDAQFIAALSPCPIQCSLSGPDPGSWTYYHAENDLNQCNQSMLFRTNLYNDWNNPESHISYQACTLDQSLKARAPASWKRQTLSLNHSIPTTVQAHLSSFAWGSTVFDGSVVDAAKAAIDSLKSYIQEDSRHISSLFARSEQVVAGLYAGGQLVRDDITTLLSNYINDLQSTNLTERQAIQVCGIQNQTISTSVLGLYVDATGNVTNVQHALGSWNNASCLENGDVVSVQTISLTLESGTAIKVGPVVESNGLQKRSSFTRRDTCSYIQAESGDGCWSLANRNVHLLLDETLVATYRLSRETAVGRWQTDAALPIGAYICCSAGSKPNFAPQQNANGSCYAYTIAASDTCSSIATTYQIFGGDGSPDSDAIENYNSNTWAWMGCNDLLIGESICLSTGDPPFPATVSSALCGPQVNDTQPTTNVSGWADLNPCPLNACCDIWGQCGITADFCTAQRASTGAPGTAPPGSNGCISNCGTQIVQSPPPVTFERLGYYESYSIQRSCLQMEPSDIPAHYTIVHWAFANITSDFDVDVSGLQDNFELFMQTPGFRRVLSFGGWAFSTDPSTYSVLRQAITPDDRETFAKSIVSFAQQYGLDGVDFDWEYPGETDIPGIPEGYATDGPYYLAFLQLLRSLLPNSITISVVAPASYWYLRAFPIAEMSEVVDYVVFETYDLHGQWDYGNKWSDPGCPGGNCLRSQVNSSETESAISMITKAGVPSNKLMLGQPLYGRSFQMTEPNCWSEECTYTGPTSGALPGECTEAAGYLANWEITQIIANSSTNPQTFSSKVAGDILVYDSTQWVSWMTPATYQNRSDWGQSLNLGGTADWAIDLNGSYPYSGNGDGEDGEGSGIVFIGPDVYTDPEPLIYCEPPCLFVFPPWVLSTTTTISPPPATVTASEIWSYIATLSGGVTSATFLTATRIMTIDIPPVSTTEIPIWNLPWAETALTSLYLTSSISLPPITLTLPLHTISTNGVTATAPATWVTYSPAPYPPYSGPTIPVYPMITTPITNGDGHVSTATYTGPFPLTTVITEPDGQSSTTTVVPVVYTSVYTDPGGQQSRTVTITQGLVSSGGGVDGSRPTPPPGPPPGPPPPGFPGVVGVKPGEPGPPPKPGQPSGTICSTGCTPEPPCEGICGCIGDCPSGGSCLSDTFTGCSGSGSGSDGEDQDPNDCTSTTTASDCQVVCPTNGAQTSCSTTCDVLIGCGYEGTTTTVYGSATAMFASPFWGLAVDETLLTTVNPNDASMWSAAASDAAALISSYYGSSVSVSASTTAAAPIPSSTVQFDLYTDYECTKLIEDVTLEVRGACQNLPNGFTALFVESDSLGPDDVVDVRVYNSENCATENPGDLWYDFNSTVSQMSQLGCMNQFGQAGDNCNEPGGAQACFNALSLNVAGYYPGAAG